MTPEDVKLLGQFEELWRLCPSPVSSNISMEFYSAAISSLPALLSKLAEGKKAKDGAYAERDKLVCALSKIFPASLERHPDSDTTWEDDWRWIVFIELPTGQATWHIHDSELAWFDHLPRFTGKVWDGHTTPEKYERVASLAAESSLVEMGRRLEEAREVLQTIADFAVGNGDVCEIIARRARAALSGEVKQNG